MARQRSAVQRDAVPGDALHVRHPGIVIHVRTVVLFLLNDRKDAGWRLVLGSSGRDGSAQDPAVGVVEGDLLAFDRHDRHDGLAALARRNLLTRLRTAQLLRRRIGGQHDQRSHCSKHGLGVAIPAPHRSGGHALMWHSLPRSKPLPGRAIDQASIAIHSATFSYTTAHAAGSEAPGARTAAGAHRVAVKGPMLPETLVRIENAEIHWGYLDAALH
jgi:hypothetical protein